MNNFTFVEDLAQFDNIEDSLVAHLGVISGKDELLRTLGNELKFPDYYGCNFDALHDLISDFYWTSARSVVIVHNGLPVLDRTTMKTYLETLADSINSWRASGFPEKLRVVFPLKDRETVSQFWHN